jgi:hypothetical protein
LKRFVAILFLLLPAFLQAQADTGLQVLRTIPVQATDFAVDNLDNLYLLTTGNTLKKYNAAGDSAGVYNDVRRFGRVSAMDVSNPLKLVLFYKDYATIALLDRFLSLKGSIDLRRSNILQASAAATSYDSHIWVFDAVENKLKKIDDKGKLLLETVDFRQLFNVNVQPQLILDQDQWVYLYDSTAGLYVFDHYGSFHKKYDIKGWNSFRVFNKNFLGARAGGLSLYVPQKAGTVQDYQFPSAMGTFQRYLVGNTQLFALGKDTVTIYQYPSWLRANQ